MSSLGKARTARSSRKPPANELESARFAANAHIVRSCPIGFAAGQPRKLQIGGRAVWIAPVVLTRPGVGPVGDVGVVALDALTQTVIDCTPRAEMEATAKQLRESNRDAIEAAFLQAGKV